jgi:hypothetical protein
MMPASPKNFPDDIIPKRLPELGIPVAFKYALLENVVVWALDCGHKVVAKAAWTEYWDNGVRKEEIICPYCKQVDPKLIYLTPLGISLILARGLEAADVRHFYTLETHGRHIITPEFDRVDRNAGPF